MAILQIRPRDPSQARSSAVVVTLCDSTGAQVDGYVTATGSSVVARYTGRTNAAGVLDVDLTPNGDITPANTGYKVDIGDRSVTIVKGGATETVGDALATPPTPLGSIAPGVPAGGLAGQVLTKTTAADYDDGYTYPPPQPPMIPMAVVNPSLTTSLALLTGSGFVLQQSDFTIPTGATLQCRLVANCSNHTSGDVFEFELFDEVSSTSVASGSRTTSSSFRQRGATGWVNVPATTWRGAVRARNATAARGVMNSCWIELRFV